MNDLLNDRAIKPKFTDKLRYAASVLDDMGLEPISIVHPGADGIPDAHIAIEDFRELFRGQKAPYREHGGCRHLRMTVRGVALTAVAPIEVEEGTVTV